MSTLGRSLLGLIGLVLAPFLALALLVRPALREGLGERLGGVARQEPGRVWVHGASMGEARAAASLLLALAREGVSGFGSSVTATGREVLRRSAPAVPHAFVPLDHPLCVARALVRVRPRALVLVETELWPSLILGALRRQVPVFIASGRISDRSFARYLRARFVLAPMLARLSGVAARSECDAERFVALGVPAARVCMLGDLKLDPSVVRAHLATDLVRATEDVAIFVAGCTHEGEEAAALAALEACARKGCEAALVIAPRHLDRIPEVEALSRSTGRRLLLRSELAGERLGNGDILLLDSIGELAALYATATVAFVGGTLAEVGGHNLLEPLFEGTPVLFGPHVANARDAARLAFESGAGYQVECAEALATAVAAHIAAPKDARARGETAKRLLESHRGSAARIANWIVEQIEQADR